MSSKFALFLSAPPTQPLEPAAEATRVWLPVIIFIALVSIIVLSLSMWRARRKNRNRKNP